MSRPVRPVRLVHALVRVGFQNGRPRGVAPTGRTQWSRHTGVCRNPGAGGAGSQVRPYVKNGAVGITPPSRGDEKLTRHTGGYPYTRNPGNVSRSRGFLHVHIDTLLIRRIPRTPPCIRRLFPSARSGWPGSLFRARRGRARRLLAFLWGFCTCSGP